MNVLIQGMESIERVKLLLELTRIDSEDVKTALIDYLAKGVNLKSAAEINSVKQQNFNRALKRVNTVAYTVEEIKEIDWARFR